ncbi:MAG TPA: dockerin type I domain-containing protein, partial [Gemmataceae bacterium]|nr:dockerin type I domain-containing protein [Gemmataceae bacterium]
MPSTTVAAIHVNDGSAQRSEVRSITVDFSSKVYFSGGFPNAAAAFQLRRILDGTLVDLTATVASDATSVTLTFSGPGTDRASGLNGGAPSLEDGRYTLTVFASNVIGPDFLPLDGDGDGTPGGDFVSKPDEPGGGPGQWRLYRLFGDANGDGVIDLTDLAQFRTSYNTAAGNPAYVSYLDADVSGAIDTIDLAQFRSRYNVNVYTVLPPETFYVNPATGNDSNDGHTPLTAWKSWDKLVAAVADGTITGGAWVTNDGNPADLSTIATPADKQAWYAKYLAGDFQLTGAHIYLDTSEAPLQVTAPLQLPPGCEIQSATASLTDLEVNVPVPASETWAQPDPTNAPNVWGTTSGTDYQGTGLYEQLAGQWAQLLPIGYNGIIAANLAAAIPMLQQAPGSFWADPSTHRLYTHAIFGGDPNTDGMARQYVPAWAEIDSDQRVISLAGGVALRIGGDGGFGFDTTSAQAAGLTGVGSAEWGNISIIDSCQWSRAGKHTFSAVGNLSSGLTIFRNDRAEEGPGAVFIGYWTHFVDYTSFSGTGSIMTIYDGDSTINGWANVDLPGGSDADPTYLSLIAHSNDSTQSFSERLIENCNFGGTISLGGPETA